MAEKKLSKKAQDRARMIALYENLGEFYGRSLSFITGIYLNLAKSDLLMQDAGKNNKKHEQTSKMLSEVTLLMKEGESSKQINEIEVEELKKGKPLSEFNYQEAEEANRSYVRATMVTADRASKVLNDTSKLRIGIVSSMNKKARAK